MSVYYLGRDARITHEVFESCCPQRQSFVIRELEYVHTVREDALFTLAASPPVRVCSAGASGAAALVAVAGWPVFDQPGVTVGGLVALAVAWSAVVLSRRARRRPLEVRAVYRGRLVCLYSTTDRQTLGQVTRALLRVLEHNEDAR